MSLTTELKDPNSPISTWMKENMRAPSVQAIVNNFNMQLAQKSPIWIDGVDPALVGTAFDYMFRWTVQRLDAYSLMAMQGAYLADRHLADLYEVSAAEPTVGEIVQLGNDRPEMRARCSIALAWFEGIFRGGRNIEKVKPCYELHNIEHFLDRVPDKESQDVQKLSETIKPIWSDRLVFRYVPNPTFLGSLDVGGADADWILGETLYDCKTSRKRQPFDIQHFLQIVGYVLLDYENQYNIQNVGRYFARQQMILEMPINRIFRDVTKSRESLRQYLSEKVAS
jgi:hypothetical protein